MAKTSRNHRTQIGTIKRHPDGFGFFIPETLDAPDVYIPKQHMNGVMTNDKVEIAVYPEPGGNRFRGEILKIIDHSFKNVIGKYQDLNDQYGIILDTNNNWGANLHIPRKWANGARSQDLVVAEITDYPTEKAPFMGKVTEVLGDASDPLYDTKKVIINHKIPHVFSGAVEKESEEFPKSIDLEDFKNRRDLTKTPLVTIDGKTAKDFDDAIFVEQTPDGFHLIVAIADVSHYVKIGSAIDTEAYERGTSVYFPNFVVPMLPEILSNELCSLKPDVLRLCLVADMKFDFQGHNKGSEFYEAVMKSHARLTYGEAQEIVDGNSPKQFGSEKFEQVKDMVLKAADLAKILMAKRFQAGSLDLEIPETELLIDETGHPVDIIRADRIFTHRLIEEMMLAANVEVARFIDRNNKEVLYRIHEPPKLEKIEALNVHLHNFGSQVHLSTQNLQKNLVKALHEFAGTPQEIILNILILRSMNQAKYSPDNVGHFGLGFEDYCHFTSPIRRYPDLIVHRVIKNILRIPGYEIPAESTLSSAGTMLSACEQRSVKAERQLQSIKKARFIHNYVGEEFEGIISSVAKFGIFVLLRQFDVDGLVKIEDLGDDHFLFIEENMMLKGKRSGLEYKLGDAVKIQVVSCDVELGQINFILTDQPRSKQNNKQKEKTKPKRSYKDPENRARANRNNPNNASFEKIDFKEASGPGRKKDVASNMEKILKMLDEGANRGNHPEGFSNRKNDKERRKSKNDRRSSGKTRIPKRSGKSKAR